MKIDQFYINGQWTQPHGTNVLELINPSNEDVVGVLSLGNQEDVNEAVKAARNAFLSYSNSTVEYRINLLENILNIYKEKMDEFAELIRIEMGSPITFSKNAQALRGVVHLEAAILALKNFNFQKCTNTGFILHEPIGVCGLITPWNWPINQIMVKVAPALATGCTVVLKPSEYSSLSTQLFAQVLHEAGVPHGVFNLVYGDYEVGEAISLHPDIDMISFTGSTQAGIKVAQNAALTVKRVAQELGGKSPNIVLDDVDFDTVITQAVAACFTNSGQSCSIPTRLLVPQSKLKRVEEIAIQAAQSYVVGDTSNELTTLGPLVNLKQYERVQSLIQTAINEGATLIHGGLGKPEGLEKGYFVKPTIFSDVHSKMIIAQEEIFGPVLVILPYSSESEAIDIANDSPYGLASYIQSNDENRALEIAKKIRAGNVQINYPPPDFNAPFGGYKQSGNGREWGEYGLHEYLEIKAVIKRNGVCK